MSPGFLPPGLAAILDPRRLFLPMRHRAHMASSYDRRGGNHDWSNYVRAEGTAAVLMDAAGPGCVTRIWTADPREGILRIYVDDAPEPLLQGRMDDLLASRPLAFGIGGESADNYERSRREEAPMGRTTYGPIPFRERCRITIDPEDDYLYYHVNFDRYPPDSVPPDAIGAGTLDQIAEALTACAAGRPVALPGRAERRHIRIAAGEHAVLLERQGSGIITGLRFRLESSGGSSADRHTLETVWALAHFDDDEPRDPSIRCPIGPLTLDFGQSKPPRSLFAGAGNDGWRYLTFPMPWLERAAIRLENRGVLPATLEVEVAVWDETPPADAHRFRAAWRIEMPCGPDHRDYSGVACRLLNQDGRDNYAFLSARGAGHFVGCGFHADLRDAPTDRAAGEGDEMYFIDDDARLSIYGTGAEDFVNDAWGIRGYVGPLSGDDLTGEFGIDPQIFGYRIHVPDVVPFRHKARFTLEHGTGNNCSGLYRSVAYWYMAPSAARTFAEERRWEERGRST